MAQNMKDDDEVVVADKNNGGSKTVTFEWMTIALIATLASFALVFLTFFFAWLGVNVQALAIILLTLAFACVAFSVVIVMLDFKKAGKVSFSVELVLNILAIFVVMSSLSMGF